MLGADLNFRTIALAAVALIAFGTGAVSFAQAPGAAGTPPPPPVPNGTSSPLISTSPLPSSQAAPTSPGMTPTPVPFTSPSEEPSAGPSSSAEGRGRRGRRGGAASPGPSPSETPEPPQFSTLDGVWEVALQPLTGARAVYSHLFITQNGNTLTGTWRRDAKTTLPFTGTFDGRLFKLTVTDGTTTELLSGYEENNSDMVGLFTDGNALHPGTPFTAAHRKKEHERGINAI